MPGAGMAYGMPSDDKRTFKFSVTNPPYLKKLSSVRLFTMLMRSHSFLRPHLSIIATTV